MTQKATSTQTGSENKQAKPAASLVDAIKAHVAAEVASFHTPGHKGQAPFADARGAWRLDVTELSGLDELANAAGVLDKLQRQAASLWGAQASFISVNGASGAILAAIMACAGRGKKILLPRNAHRSAIHALVLSGLEPVWYEPEWQTDWALFGIVEPAGFADALQAHASDLACALVVSPTYAGAISDIGRLSASCHARQIPIIVDEAHGAHLIPGTAMPTSALCQGADLVAHSLHKTLPALTQTGLIHIGKDSLVPPDAVRCALNALQTSSPSYLLMASVEEAIACAKEAADKLLPLRDMLRKHLGSLPGVHIYEPHGQIQDPLHLLVRIDAVSASKLSQECSQLGIFAEATLGTGVLFLLGAGTRTYEVESLSEALEHIAVGPRLCKTGTEGTNDQRRGSSPPEAGLITKGTDAAEQSDGTSIDYKDRPVIGEQVLSPRQAFFAQCETVDISAAGGRIAAECIAPCPPGTAVVVPGARITDEAIRLCTQTRVRVVVESGPRRT